MTNDIISAYHEWDDPHAFRVYLVREGGPDAGEPMEAVYTGDSVECRLFRAAFLKCYKDLAHQEVGEPVLGFQKEAAAKRVAKAVNAEIKRIKKGEPPMTDEQFAIGLQIAKLMNGGKRRR